MCSHVVLVSLQAQSTQWYILMVELRWPLELPMGSNIIDSNDVITALKYYQVFGDTLDWWMELTEVQYQAVPLAYHKQLI